MATETAAISEVAAAFATAAVTTFQEMCGTDVALSEDAVGSPATLSADTYAAIELQREPPGHLLCAFPSAVLHAFADRYLPAGTMLTPEIVDDAAGEFANVIAGQAKTILKSTPYHYTLATPRVISNAESVPPGQASDLLLQFESGVGRFYFRIKLRME